MRESGAGYYSSSEDQYSQRFSSVLQLYDKIKLCDTASPKYRGVLDVVHSLSEIALSEQENEHETRVLENTRVDFVALAGVRTDKLYTL